MANVQQCKDAIQRELRKILQPHELEQVRVGGRCVGRLGTAGCGDGGLADESAYARLTRHFPCNTMPCMLRAQTVNLKRVSQVAHHCVEHSPHTRIMIHNPLPGGQVLRTA